MRKDLEKKLKKYFEENAEFYDDFHISFTMENIEDYLNGGDEVDLLAQVAYAIGEKSRHKTTGHDRFFKYLIEHNGLGQDILEVSSGAYPILADKIDKYQTKIGKGTITAIDPLLIPTKLGNIKLNRSLFDKDTDISKYSLVTGYYPCEPTYDIIVKANEEDKDFTIALCGCNHFNKVYPYFGMAGYNTWINFLYNTAMATVSHNREIVMEDVEGFEYPLILSRIKK